MTEHFEVEFTYSDDYWDDEGGFTYLDPKKIGPKLDECMNFAGKLLLAKNYEQATELYESLYMMPFYAYYEDSGEIDEVEFEELYESKIITLKPKLFAKNYLYTLYQITPANKRPQSMFHAWSWRICETTEISELFTVGSEPLPDSQQFLDDFIELLLKKPQELATTLLLDAVKLSKTYEDEDLLLKLAKKTSDTKPEVYLWVIDRLSQESKFERAFTIGKTAMKEIPRSFVQRSVLAESLMALADKITISASETVYLFLESFLSSPAVDKLFRLLESDLNTAQLNQVLRFVSQKEVTNKQVMLFFLQQFDTCFAAASLNRQVLGWRNSDKGQIIPLFLLLFTNNIKTPAAAMLTTEISSSCYRGDQTDFTTAFQRWKRTVQIDPKTETKIFAWCKKEVEKREEALVQTKFRSHYGRAAALLITMGEAEEALGDAGAAERTWQKYAKKHSRKHNFRAFMNELHSDKKEN